MERESLGPLTGSRKRTSADEDEEPYYDRNKRPRMDGFVPPFIVETDHDSEVDKVEDLSNQQDGNPDEPQDQYELTDEDIQAFLKWQAESGNSKILADVQNHEPNTSDMIQSTDHKTFDAYHAGLSTSTSNLAHQVQNPLDASTAKIPLPPQSGYAAPRSLDPRFDSITAQHVDALNPRGNGIMSNPQHAAATAMHRTTGHAMVTPPADVPSVKPNNGVTVHPGYTMQGVKMGEGAFPMFKGGSFVQSPPPQHPTAASIQPQVIPKRMDGLAGQNAVAQRQATAPMAPSSAAGIQGAPNTSGHAPNVAPGGYVHPQHVVVDPRLHGKSAPIVQYLQLFRRNLDEQALLGGSGNAPISLSLLPPSNPMKQGVLLLPRDLWRYNHIVPHTRSSLAGLFTSLATIVLHQPHTSELFKRALGTLLLLSANVERTGEHYTQECAAKNLQSSLELAQQISIRFTSWAGEMLKKYMPPNFQYPEPPYSDLSRTLHPQAYDMSVEQRYWLALCSQDLKSQALVQMQEVPDALPMIPYQGTFNSVRNVPYRLRDLAMLRSSTPEFRLQLYNYFKQCGNDLRRGDPTTPAFRHDWEGLVQQSAMIWNNECHHYNRPDMGIEVPPLSDDHPAVAASFWQPQVTGVEEQPDFDLAEFDPQVYRSVARNEAGNEWIPESAVLPSVEEGRDQNTPEPAIIQPTQPTEPQAIPQESRQKAEQAPSVLQPQTIVQSIETTALVNQPVEGTVAPAPGRRLLFPSPGPTPQQPTTPVPPVSQLDDDDWDEDLFGPKDVIPEEKKSSPTGETASEPAPQVPVTPAQPQPGRRIYPSPRMGSQQATTPIPSIDNASLKLGRSGDRPDSLYWETPESANGWNAGQQQFQQHVPPQANGTGFTEPGTQSLSSAVHPLKKGEKRGADQMLEGETQDGTPAPSKPKRARKTAKKAENRNGEAGAGTTGRKKGRKAGGPSTQKPTAEIVDLTEAPKPARKPGRLHVDVEINPTPKYQQPKPRSGMLWNRPPAEGLESQKMNVLDFATGNGKASKYEWLRDQTVQKEEAVHRNPFNNRAKAGSKRRKGAPIPGVAPIAQPLPDPTAKECNPDHPSWSGKYSLDHDDHEKFLLPNGNYECFHNCKDMQGCKHKCCKNGFEGGWRKYSKEVTSKRKDKILKQRKLFKDHPKLREQYPHLAPPVEDEKDGGSDDAHDGGSKNGDSKNGGSKNVGSKKQPRAAAHRDSVGNEHAAADVARAEQHEDDAVTQDILNAFNEEEDDDEDADGGAQFSGFQLEDPENGNTRDLLVQEEQRDETVFAGQQGRSSRHNEDDGSGSDDESDVDSDDEEESAEDLARRLMQAEGWDV